MPQNDILWQGVSGLNNPCPAGFRLPTETELEVEFNPWNSDDSAGALGSPLKLVMAGYRYYSNGALVDAGSQGIIWSSTTTGITCFGLSFSGSNATITGTHSRAHGRSVCCIKD